MFIPAEMTGTPAPIIKAADNDPEIPPFKGTNPSKRKQFGQFVLTLEPAKIDSTQKFVYSNAGYTLAALMVEKVTNKS